MLFRSVWHGLFAPKGTPPAVVERLNKAMRSTLADPAIMKRFSEMGVILPVGDRLRAAALQSQLASEINNWGQVLVTAGAKIE